VILATNTHITPYALTRMLAFHPEFHWLHTLGRFQAYERGSPLHPLLHAMHNKPTTVQEEGANCHVTARDGYYTRVVVLTLICFIGGLFAWNQYHLGSS
jgi:hypothetical protein